jgi:predicted dinucleotide-binding enzyme
MDVTIVGTGNMGRGIATRLLAGGHGVTLLDREVGKAFNTTFAGTLVEGEVAGQPLDVYVAGDDAGAKETVSQLVRDGGLVAIDTGPLRRAR